MSETSSKSSTDGDDLVNECYTNTQFKFDHETSFISNDQRLSSLGPEVVRKFGNKGASFGEIGDATDIHVNPKIGSTLVTDMLNSRILHFDKNGKSNICYQTNDMIEPFSLDVSSKGTVYVTSKKNKCVIKFLKSGEIEQPFGSEHLTCPSGIAIDENSEKIYVTDVQADSLSVFDIEGKFLGNLGNQMSPIEQFRNPRYVCVAPTGEVIVCDSGNHCLKVYDSKGNYIQKIGSFGKKEGQLKFPYGICTDSFGNIIVADHYNNRVSYFNQNGEFIRHLVTDSDGIKRPQGVFMTEDMKLYVTHGDIKATQIIVFDMRSNSCTSQKFHIDTGIVHI